MNQWKTLTRISQVKKNDAVRIAVPGNSGKRWIFIVEKVISNEIHLSGGENHPSLTVVYQDELEGGRYEFVNLNNPNI